MIRRFADRTRALLALLGPLGAGSRALLLRLIERFGWKTALAGLAVAMYAAARYRTWIVWMIAAWCAAAWMHVPDEADEEAGEDQEEQPEEAPVDTLPELLWELIGDAPGVHLNSIVEHLHESGLDTTCDRAAVKDALGRRGIPVRPSVREADRRVNQGVHRDDLTTWEQARSPAAVVSLSKVRSNPVATALTCDVAEPATAVATPATAQNDPES